MTDEQKERFWQKVRKTETCWLWTAGKSGNGYGQFGFEKSMRPAHRIAYMLSVGPIPEGLDLMHACDNPACVNPSHLSPGTRTENMQDALAKKRHWQANKTHCAQGHPYSGDNVLPRPEGGRFCLACWKANNDKRNRAKKLIKA